MIKAKSFNELHGVIDASVRQHADIVNRDDAGVFELREDARFTHQPTREVAICVRRVEDLERDTAEEFFVFGGVDRAHATARDEIAHLVACAGKIRSLRATEPFESFVA